MKVVSKKKNFKVFSCLWILTSKWKQLDGRERWSDAGFYLTRHFVRGVGGSGSWLPVVVLVLSKVQAWFHSEACLTGAAVHKPPAAPTSWAVECGIIEVDGKQQILTGRLSQQGLVSAWNEVSVACGLGQPGIWPSPRDCHRATVSRHPAGTCMSFPWSLRCGNDVWQSLH